MSDPVVVVPYDPEWPHLFAELGVQLRSVLGSVALRIDHIGSTAIAGMVAKPIVDVQVSVAGFEPLDAFRLPLAELGFVHRASNPDLSKRYFREAPGTRRTHIHVRVSGDWSEQFALLFRDYLRTHEAEATWFGGIKQQLAEQFANDRQGYTDAKSWYLWEIMKKADVWHQETGHTVGPSDA